MPIINGFKDIHFFMTFIKLMGGLKKLEFCNFVFIKPLNEECKAIKKFLKSIIRIIYFSW